MTVSTRRTKRAAWKAVEDLLSDTSVPKKTTRRDLCELKDFVALTIESLDESDEEQST